MMDIVLLTVMLAFGYTTYCTAYVSTKNKIKRF